MLVAEAEHHGTIESDERRMIAGVMRLGDRAVRAVMTPRTEVDWINLRLRTRRRPARLLMETQHSRLPVGEGSVDAMVGVVQTRDILAALLAGAGLRPAQACAHRAHRPRPGRRARRADDAEGIAKCRWRWCMTSTATSKASSRRPTFSRRSPACSAPTPTRRSRHAVQREDGSWLLAGYMQADEMARPSRHRPAGEPRLRDRRRLSPVASAPSAGDRRDASTRRAGASRWSTSTAAASTRSSPRACRCRAATPAN